MEDQLFKNGIQSIMCIILCRGQSARQSWGTCHYLQMDPFLQILTAYWMPFLTSKYSDTLWIQASLMIITSLLPKPLGSLHCANVFFFTGMLCFGGHIWINWIFIFPLMFYRLTSTDALFLLYFVVRTQC